MALIKTSQLKKQWWHRLLLVVFILACILLFFIANAINRPSSYYNTPTTGDYLLAIIQNIGFICIVIVIINILYYDGIIYIVYGKRGTSFFSLGLEYIKKIIKRWKSRIIRCPYCNERIGTGLDQCPYCKENIS